MWHHGVLSARGGVKSLIVIGTVLWFDDSQVLVDIVITATHWHGNGTGYLLLLTLMCFICLIEVYVSWTI